MRKYSLNSLGGSSEGYGGKNKSCVIAEKKEILLIGPSVLLELRTTSGGSGAKEESGQALANQDYDPDEPRIPAGQPGGGQWTSAGKGAAPRWKPPLGSPVRPLLSGGNNLGPLEDTFDPSAPYSQAEYWSDVAKVWEGYGNAITEAVCGLWNTARHPVNAAEGVAVGVTDLVSNPVGTLKAIGQQIGDDFTSGDPRKAGKLVGLVLLSMASPEADPEELAALIPKVEAASAGDPVILTAKEAEVVDKTLLKPYEGWPGTPHSSKGGF